MQQNPSNAELDRAIQTARQHQGAGRLREAEEICRRVLRFRPEDARAWHTLGTLAYQAIQYEAAVEHYRRALAVAPEMADVHSSLGQTLRKMGRVDEAVAACRESVRLRPEIAELHFNLANAERDAGDKEGAIRSYRKAVELKPGYASAWFNLGEVFAATARLAEARDCCRRALEADPGHVNAVVSLSNTCLALGEMGEAERHLRKLISLRPKTPELYSNLANTLAGTGRLGEALAACREALRLSPEDLTIRSNYLLLLHYSDAVTPEEVFREHRVWGEVAEKNIRPMPPREIDPAEGRRLRVGYLSPDFRDHPVSKWIEPILEHHDRGAFEIFCYSTAHRSDAVTDRLRAHVEHWRDMGDAPNEAIAARVREDGIDVLVDLSGHTSDSRLLVLARRPAPVQATYLGYPDTTGLAGVDYLVTDAHLDPPGRTEGLHTERLVRLPHCFSCFKPPADAPDVAPSPAERNGFITFGSFNNFNKIGRRMMGAWVKLLRAVPGSRLLVKSSNHMDREAKERTLTVFQELGADTGRIDFAERQETVESYLAQFGRVDVALDTFPYHGTTTTADALWMGVPVVTLAGETHAARVGVSLLNAVGLPELVAGDDEAYVRIAAELAADVPRLARLRGELRGRMGASPLTDGRGFTHHLEEAYRGMWAAHRGGVQPRP